jgi:hypothetical protein
MIKCENCGMTNTGDAGTPCACCGKRLTTYVYIVSNIVYKGHPKKEHPNFVFENQPPKGNEEDLDERVCVLISDETGWCVETFKVEVMTKEKYEDIRKFIMGMGEGYDCAKFVKENFCEDDDGDEGAAPPSCDLPYPPPKMKDGVWEEGCDTEEREEEITLEYIKGYGIPSETSIIHFTRNYNEDNSAVEQLRLMTENWRGEGSGGEMFNDIYKNMTIIIKNPFDEERLKCVGLWVVKKYPNSHMKVLRLSYYLVCWYMKSSNNCVIKSYPRLLEHYWSGIGDWMA